MDSKARAILLEAIAEKEKFVPSKSGLDAHREAANSFWAKHPGPKDKGITVDDSPEAKALINERYNTGETIDDILPDPVCPHRGRYIR